MYATKSICSMPDYFSVFSTSLVHGLIFGFLGKDVLDYEKNWTFVSYQLMLEAQNLGALLSMI